MKTIYTRLFAGKSGLYSLGLMAAILLIVLPTTLDIFRLNMVGKYLTYAFVALGLVLLWGKAGVLSLGQGVFFGLGGYCMAMFLKLESSDPMSTKIHLTRPRPQYFRCSPHTAPLNWLRARRALESPSTLAKVRHKC